VKVADVAECYAKHADALVRFAATQVGPTHADDVVSAAVIGALRAPTTDVIDVRAYLYTSVANAARKHWRSLDRRTRRERLIARSDVFEQREPDLALAAALARLSPQQRAVIHLTYWDDLTPPMVAARLSVSDGTVRRQLARARRRLKEVIDDDR
jgi:RNA polymerase sigma-70 factor (ECF subfamily)